MKIKNINQSINKSIKKAAGSVKKCVKNPNREIGQKIKEKRENRSFCYVTPSSMRGYFNYTI